MEILTALITAGATVAGVTLTNLFAHRKTGAETHLVESQALSVDIDNKLKLDGIEKSINEAVDLARRVEKQVSNSHVSNLRDDVDGLKADVANLITINVQRAEVAARHEAKIDRLTDLVRGNSQALADFTEGMSCPVKC